MTTSAGASPQPGRVQAWRHVEEHGDLPRGSYDRAAAVADLAAHWHQRLIVGLDGVLEQDAPGAERLARILTAWLDLARATPRVRRLVEDEATGRALQVLERHRRVLVGILAEDLGAVGAPDPHRSAADLLREAAVVAAREDVAARVLRSERAALLGPVTPAPRRRRGLRRLRLVPA